MSHKKDTRLIWVNIFFSLNSAMFYCLNYEFFLESGQELNENLRTLIMMNLFERM